MNKTQAWIAVGIAILCAIVTGIVTLVTESNPTPVVINDVGVVITVPAHSSPPGKTVIEEPTLLRGTLRDSLPAGSVLWVVIRKNEDVSTYQPTGFPCSVDAPSRTFDCGSVFVGGPDDHGVEFNVLVILANGNAVKVFLEYDRLRPTGQYPGLRDLPAGSTVAATVAVVRA